MQVKGIELRSASVLVESEGEDTYKVRAVAGYNNGSVNTFDGGEVRRFADNVMVASWSRYSPENLNVNFMTSNVEEMCAVTGKINEFIESVASANVLTGNLSL